MSRVVVRKSYRCLPGKRRDLLAALQRLDAVAAEAGWPRGRYLFVETKAPGEPDLEVEFLFESYAEMEQLERRLRERLSRAIRENPRPAGFPAGVGNAGQEFLLEPSATRYLLLLDDAATSSAAQAARRAAAAAAAPAPSPTPTTASPTPASPAFAPPPAPSPAPAAGRAARPGAATNAPSAQSPAAPAAASSARGPAAEPPDFYGADENWHGEDEDFSDLEPVEEPEELPPPSAKTQEQNLAEARATLNKAERTVNLAPRPRSTPPSSTPPSGRRSPAEKDDRSA